MSQNWYYRVLGEEFGPVSFDTVGELAQKGLLSPGDEVRDGEKGPWVAAESIVGLFPEPEDSDEIAQPDVQLSESSEQPAQDLAAESSLLEELLGGDRQPSQTAQSSVDAPRGTQERTSAGPPTEKSPIESEWYFQVAGREVGPVTLAQLILLGESGRLAADDLVRQTGVGDWTPAGEVDQLSAALLVAPASRSASPPDTGTPPAASEDDDFELSEQVVEASPPQAEKPPVPSPPPMPRQAAVAGVDRMQPGPRDLQVRNKGADVAEPAGPKAGGRKVDKGWYYRWEGDAFGPFRYAELRRMARSQQITPETEVKQGKNGEWVPAGTCEGLFDAAEIAAAAARQQAAASAEEPQADPSVDETEPASGQKEKRGWFRRGRKKERPAVPPDVKARAKAAERLAKTAKLSKSKPKPSKAAASKSQKAGKSSGSSSMDVSWIGDLFGVMVGAAGKAKWVFVAAAVVVGVLWAAPGLSGLFRSDMAYYETLNSIYAEHKRLRESGASDTEWSQLAARAETEIAPLVENLKSSVGDKEAGAGKPLYYAALVVPKMLETARKKPTPPEKSFTRFLHEAAELLDVSASGDTTSDNSAAP